MAVRGKRFVLACEYIHKLIKKEFVAIKISLINRSWETENKLTVNLTEFIFSRIKRHGLAPVLFLNGRSLLLSHFS